jgi:hypothetical protein
LNPVFEKDSFSFVLFVLSDGCNGFLSGKRVNYPKTFDRCLLNFRQGGKSRFKTRFFEETIRETGLACFMESRFTGK